jgi:hypothetical protein
MLIWLLTKTATHGATDRVSATVCNSTVVKLLVRFSVYGRIIS